MRSSPLSARTGPESLAKRREQLIAQVHLQRLQWRAEFRVLSAGVHPVSRFGARLARGLALRVAVMLLRRGLRVLRRRVQRPR